MKYLLTEEEYSSLVEAKRKQATAVDQTKLNEFCILVAENMPVEVSWRDGPPKPWGCIHAAPKTNTCGYCDYCPSQDFCTLSKDYSK